MLSDYELEILMMSMNDLNNKLESLKCDYRHNDKICTRTKSEIDRIEKEIKEIEDNKQANNKRYETMISLCGQDDIILQLIENHKRLVNNDTKINGLKYDLNHLYDAYNLQKKCCDNYSKKILPYENAINKLTMKLNEHNKLKEELNNDVDDSESDGDGSDCDERLRCRCCGGRVKFDGVKGNKYRIGYYFCDSCS